MTLRWELAAPTSAQLLALLMARMENLLSAQVVKIITVVFIIIIIIAGFVNRTKPRLHLPLFGCH